MPNPTIRNALTSAVAIIALFSATAGIAGETHTLTNGWSFHRDDGKAVSDPQTLPASAWEKVSLPHAARIEARIPHQAWQGTAFYKRTLTIKPKAGERAYLRFEGAMNVADVWLNGKPLGQHLGGYLPFTYDLTDGLSSTGQNELLVRINNEDNAITGPKPLKNLDYVQHGGLYRQVTLTIKPKVHITDEMWSNTQAGGGLFITYPKVEASSATVRVRAEVFNSGQGAKTVTVQHSLARNGAILETAQTQVSLKGGERRHVESDIAVADPSLWSPKAPNLYDLKTTVIDGEITDAVSTRIGIRRFEFKSDKLFINGEETFLRGVNRHQEYPYVGYAISDAANYRDALLIKRAGFDYVRLSHYPHSKAFMDAADALGLVLLDAIPGWQYFNKDPAFTTQALKTCTDMIRRDRNHASVLAWECSLNETNMSPELIETFHKTVKTEYPGDQGISAGWKPETYDLYLQARQHRDGKSALPDKPLIVSEYGDWEYYAQNAGFNQADWADLKPADRSSRQLLDAGERHLLQQAANVAEAHDDNFNTKAFADGYWVMFDYGRGYAPDLEASGVASIDRLPKFAEAFFRSQRPATETSPEWGGGPMVQITSYWDARSSPKVRVFSNAEEVELFLNGKSLGKQKSQPSATHPNLKHPPLTFDAGAFQAGELKAVAYLGGQAVAEHLVATPGDPTTLKVWIDDMGVKPTAGDTVFVRAQVLDAAGHPISVSGRDVTFNVTGGYEIFGPSTVKTEAGIASILVRTGVKTGQVHAQSIGLTERSK
jgi:beta-galactosidase